MQQGANTQNFVQIGRINRSHGLGGEIIITFDDDITTEAENLELVYLQNERGDFYPARILSLYAEGKRNNQSFFVQFGHIADRNAAEKLKGQAIWVEAEKAGTLIAASETDLLIDLEVVDEHGRKIGLVTEIMDNPAHPILVVATTSGELLIPYVEHYVLRKDDAHIYCRNLSHLEDL